MPETLPLIDDPWFYVAAVAAVLITGLSKSGFASGFSTLATPLMAMTVPVPQAAAILLPLLMAMDITGLQQLWRERSPQLVRLLVPPGLAGIGVGWLLFGLLSPAAVSALVGGLTLAFLAQRLLFPPRADGRPAPLWVGRLCALLSGFTSFICHAGGPPLSAYVLPMKLEPRLLSGTMAVFFASVNVAKVLPYATLGLIDLRNMLTALVLLPVAPLGVWAGVWLVRRTSATWFYRLAYAGMAVAGVKLLYDGLR